MIQNIKIMALALLIPTLGISQITLTNNNGAINVGANTSLRVTNGAIVNQNNAQVINNGNLHVAEDYTQNTGATYTGGATSLLVFDGNSTQNLISDAALTVAQLKVNNNSSLVLGNTLTLAQSLDLSNNSSVELGNQNLVMTSGATVANYGASAYILTNGTGSFQQEVGGTNTIFPIGNATYMPMNLSNNGTLDYFTVRTENQALDSYPAGAAQTDGVVGRAWVIGEQVAGGSDLALTLEWDEADDELTGFDRTQSGISYWNGSTWQASPSWTNATNVSTSRWSQTRSGITALGTFIVEDALNVLGILPITDNKNIGVAVYPNPVNDYLNVQFSLAQTEEATLQLMDTYGRTLYNRVHTVAANEQLTLELFSELVPATYFLSIQVDGERTVQKVVKK